MENRSFEKSPFYVEYGGISKGTKTYGYHVKKEFVKPLKEFIDVRFPAGASDSEIMEQIVADYYFRYALDRNYYEKSITILMPKEDLNKPNPRLFPALVNDRYANCEHGELNIDNETKKMVSYHFKAYTSEFKDADSNIKESILKAFFDDSYYVHKEDVFDAFGEIYNKDSFNNFVVIEISLNNYLDAKKDGVYGYLKEDDTLKENQHCGIAVVNSKSEIVDAEPFVITYNWKLNPDFSIDILDMVKLSDNDLARLIADYNLGLVGVLNQMLNSNYSLEKKLDEKDKLIDELEFVLEQTKKERLEILDVIKDNGSDD